MSVDQTNTPERQLMHLLDQVLSGSQSDAESEELRLLLDEHVELRPAVIEQLRTHSLLQWEMTHAILPIDSDIHAFDECGSPNQSISQTTVRTQRPTRYWRWAIAATLLLSASMTGIYSLRNNEPMPDVLVGRVVEHRDAQFGKKSKSLGKGDRLARGPLELVSGSLMIEFDSGVEMEISGPATCDIESAMLVRLSSGQATAQVPRWARGFTIETPDVEVIDLGTRFGVATRADGKTDVVVFEGEVDLKPAASSKRQFTRRLTQGEAARIAKSGEMERIFQVHGDWLDNAWSTQGKERRPCAIGAVWDNFGATKSVSYYQIIPGDLSEDSPAYVDHPHQWNGASPEGMPAFLEKADYVRTVNDYRYRGELSLHVEFAEDAMLYVFFDNRVRVPEWLQQQFEDTGADIGLDEDAWHGNPTFSVESGAGASIDNVFSVWKRRCDKGEVFVLGSMGVGREARAMYGFAAVAIGQTPAALAMR